MLKPDMKRFYRAVSIAPPSDDGEEAGGFSILLDGRRIKSPVGRALAVPSCPLAEEVAKEWEAQGEKIVPATMPLTQLAFTALDRIAPEQQEVAARIARFGETDLLCYRAEAPLDLVQRQAENWDPLLAWAKEELGAEMIVTTGIVHVAQPTEALDRLAQAVHAMDPFRLTVLAAVAQAAGSLLIGLALVHGRLGAVEAFAASQLDEDYQSELWGQDKEALDRQRALLAEISQAETFLSLL